jgi:hypothetical protein
MTTSRANESRDDQPTPDVSGALTIVMGLHRGRTMRAVAGGRATWMPLDLRRSFAAAKTTGALPPGLPFAMGLSPSLIAWLAAWLDDRRAAPAAVGVRASTAEPSRLPTPEHIRPHAIPPPQVILQAGLPSMPGIERWLSSVMRWTPGIMQLQRPSAVTAAAAMWRPVAEPSRAALASMPTAMRVEAAARTASASASPEASALPERALREPMRSGPRTTAAPALDLRSPQEANANRNLMPSPIPARPATDGQPLWSVLPARAAPRPVLVYARATAADLPKGALAPALRPMRLAAAMSVSRLASGRMPTDDGGVPPPLVTRSIAPQTSAQPRDQPPRAATAEGPQWPALTPRRTMTGIRLPAAASVAAAPLHQLVEREVARQIAAIKPPASAAAPTLAKPSTPAIDVPSDDVVRRLLSRMRTLSQEERFRSGLLR